MQASLQESAFDWIRSGRDEILSSEDPRWVGNFVSHLMPSGFERYAKIFHRLDANYKHIDNSLSPEEIAILGIPECKTLRQLVESKRLGAERTRITWREVAKVLEVPFKPELIHAWFWSKLKPDEICWSRFILGPADGCLENDEMEQLVQVLAPFTVGKECFFRLPEIPFLARDEKPTLLFQGRLEEVSQESQFHFTPEYWWPSDQTWCVCSDYDLYFTIVGGSDEAITALLENPVLESIEVTQKTRIDSLIPISL